MSTGSIPQSVLKTLEGVVDEAGKAVAIPAYKYMKNVKTDLGTLENLLLEGFGKTNIKKEGAAVETDDYSAIGTNRVFMKTFAKGQIVTTEAIADNRYPIIYDVQAKLSNATQKSVASFFTDMLNLGTDANTTYINNETLFSAAHAGGKHGGAYSNRKAAAALTITTFEQMITQIRSATDSRGMLLNLQPQKLIVPSALEFVARRILGSSQMPGWDVAGQPFTNDINPSKGMIEIVVDPYLSANAPWFVTTDRQAQGSGTAASGLVAYTREDLKFISDRDHGTYNHVFSSYCRHGRSVTDFMSVFGCI